MNFKIINKNKKALSTIIATMMIILLSLVAISTIWITISSLINTVQYSPEFSCQDFTIQPPIRINKACFNLTTEDAEITLKRNIDNFEIQKLIFIMQSSTQSSEWCCGLPNCPQCQVLKPGTTQNYLFDFTEQNIPNKVALKIGECFIEEKEIGEC